MNNLIQSLEPGIKERIENTLSSRGFTLDWQKNINNYCIFVVEMLEELEKSQLFLINEIASLNSV